MKLKSKIFLLFILMILSIQSISFADEVSLNSEAAILVEVSTGRILYEKNSTKQLYPASTTKILTAILVIENCKLDESVARSTTSSYLRNIFYIKDFYTYFAEQQLFSFYIKFKLYSKA